MTTPNPSFPQSDGTLNHIVSTYASRFGRNDDQTTVTEAERAKRAETAAEGVDQYYDFASTCYENGWSTHFHYTPFYPDDTIQSAMAFYEHRFAWLAGLKPGMKVLDVGCGIGAPAREIARFVGCEIVGITINQGQVDRAIWLTAKEGLQGRCTFVRGDFLNLPFADASFDAAYAVEATVHAPSLAACYAGVARVLKPGAPFAVSEWVMTPKYDPKDPKHIGIRNRIERGNALPEIHTDAQARAAMDSAGFELFHDEDYVKRYDYFQDMVAHAGTVSKRGTKDQERGHSPDLQSPVLIPFRRSTGGVDFRYAIPSVAPTPAPASFPYGKRAYRPWYWPLAGEYEEATTWLDWWTAFKMSTFFRRVSKKGLWLLEALHIIPRGNVDAMITMEYCVDSVVEGAREDIFTPCWWSIGRKRGDAPKL